MAVNPPMPGTATSSPGASPIAPGPAHGTGAVLEKVNGVDGCTFRTWAVFADQVYVVGDFTTPPWGKDVKVPMARDSADGAGRNYWSVWIPGVGDGAQYKFVLGSGAEAPWKVDPYCRDATGHLSSTGTRQENNGIVDDPTFDWQDQRFAMPSWNELVIYEMHIGTFNTNGGIPGTFQQAIDKLDHLVELGVNAIEIMPAEEFDTETSMGYNPNLLFAIDSAYGTEKVVQKFVKAAHDKGLAVIFDVVYNHFGPGTGDCLWQYDGWSQDGRPELGGIYFYEDDRRICAFGDRPDFGRPEVRQFIRDNAMMWLHEFRADGLRLDSTLNIRRAIGKNGDDRGEIPEGWALLQWINNDKDHDLPWNLTIAEDLQNNAWITKETGAGGAGCNSQWDVSFYGVVRDAVVAPLDASRNMQAIAGAIYNRYNGDAFRRVIYSESHDEVTIQNGVWLGRMTEKIWWGQGESWFAKKRSTLAAGLALTSPGIPMLFQGQEVLEIGTWADNPNINGIRANFDWTRKNRFPGIFALYRDLIHLRRNWNNNTRGLCGQHVNVFHVNDDAKIVAFHRWSEGGPGDDVIVVANFGSQPYHSYNIGFPRTGSWYLRFNSDWNGYDGSFGNEGYDTTADQAPNQGMPCSGNIGVGAYTVIILSQ